MLNVSKTKKPGLLILSDFTITEDIEDGIVHVTFFKYGRFTIELYHDTELNNEIITTENWKNHPVVLWIGEETIYCPSVELAVQIVNGLEK